MSELTADLKIRVIAAVIERGGKLLICERPLHKRHGGLWEFPGGKIEERESDLDAAKRELREELDVEVTAVGETVFSVADPGSEFVIEFIDVMIEGEPQALEHSQIVWVDPNELLQYRLAPSDLRYVEHRLANGSKVGN
jgi:8-oxo-dGTP diphosphatase